MTMNTKTLLKSNSNTTRVIELQQLLNTVLGLQLKLDGEMGPLTVKALKDFQQTRGLKVDGIYGDKTFTALTECINKPSIEGVEGVENVSKPTYSLEIAATELKCSVAAIQAVSAVESSGGGFLANGKPKILFERHWMYKRLKFFKVNPDSLVKAQPNLVNRLSGGYSGGALEYKRLDKAIAIHRQSALESTSWGEYQIMGFHWQKLGYSSIEDFVACMGTTKEAHLEAFVRFVKHNTALLGAIQAKNWVQFARIYNGPKYAINAYDTKMANAFSKFA